MVGRWVKQASGRQGASAGASGGGGRSALRCEEQKYIYYHDETQSNRDSGL